MVPLCTENRVRFELAVRGQSVVHELAESDLVAGDQSVEVMKVESADLRPEALVRALDQTRSSKRRRADSNR